MLPLLSLGPIFLVLVLPGTILSCFRTPALYQFLPLLLLHLPLRLCLRCPSHHPHHLQILHHLLPLIHFTLLSRKVLVPVSLSIPLVILFLVSLCLLLFLVLLPHFLVFPFLRPFKIHCLTKVCGKPWNWRWKLYIRMGCRILFLCCLGNVLLVVNGCIISSFIHIVPMIASMASKIANPRPHHHPTPNPRALKRINTQRLRGVSILPNPNLAALIPHNNLPIRTKTYRPLRDWIKPFNLTSTPFSANGVMQPTKREGTFPPHL